MSANLSDSKLAETLTFSGPSGLHGFDRCKARTVRLLLLKLALVGARAYQADGAFTLVTCGRL